MFILHGNHQFYSGSIVSKFFLGKREVSIFHRQELNHRHVNISSITDNHFKILFWIDKKAHT